MSVLEDKAKLARLDEVIAANVGTRGAVMRTLQSAQDIFGHVPREVQRHIAEGLGVTLSEVYGVATFYSQFSLTPRGRFVIGLCMGTACYVRQAQHVLEKAEAELNIKTGGTTDDARFTLNATRCLGACGLAPVLMVNHDVYGRLVPDDIPGILEKYKAM